MIKKNQNFDLKELKDIGFPYKEYLQIKDAIELKKGKLRIIGGNVRDYLLKKKISSNPDLATNLNPEEVIFCMKKKKINYLDSAVQYGTIVAIINNIKFEITSLRKDISSDGRWPVVSFTDEWVEDAKRRDFTINSIYLSEQGFFDPLKGMNDLNKKRVIFIGNPKDRIIEDNLRILRFLRFSCLYAKDFDSKGLEAINFFSDKLKTVSFERRFSELKKFICLKTFEKDFKKIMNTRVLQNCFENEISELAIKFFKIERKLGDISYLRRVKFFLRTSDNLKFILNNSSFKKNEIKRISETLDIDYSLDYVELLYRNNKESLIDQIIFDYVDKKINESLVIKIYDICHDWKKPRFPISGNDIKSLGISDGLIIGKLLKEVENWWVKKGLKPNKQGCIKKAKSLLP